jgi:hypothetical protein
VALPFPLSPAAIVCWQCSTASDCRIQSWSISVSDLAACRKDIWVHKAKKDTIVRKAQVTTRSIRNVLLSKQEKGAMHNLRSTFEAVHGSESSKRLRCLL